MSKALHYFPKAARATYHELCGLKHIYIYIHIFFFPLSLSSESQKSEFKESARLISSNDFKVEPSHASILILSSLLHSFTFIGLQIHYSIFFKKILFYTGVCVC